MFREQNLFVNIVFARMNSRFARIICVSVKRPSVLRVACENTMFAVLQSS